MEKLRPFYTALLRQQNENIWVEWQQWTTCRETCGTCIQSRFRDCHNPTSDSKEAIDGIDEKDVQEEIDVKESTTVTNVKEVNPCGTKNKETRSNETPCPSMINMINITPFDYQLQNISFINI